MANLRQFVRYKRQHSSPASPLYICRGLMTDTVRAYQGTLKMLGTSRMFQVTLKLLVKNEKNYTITFVPWVDTYSYISRN